jgi:hypothetical protein
LGNLGFINIIVVVFRILRFEKHLKAVGGWQPTFLTKMFRGLSQ